MQNFNLPTEGIFWVIGPHVIYVKEVRLKFGAF